jgi:hypothetical protein
MIYPGGAQLDLHYQVGRLPYQCQPLPMDTPLEVRYGRPRPVHH